MAIDATTSTDSQSTEETEKDGGNQQDDDSVETESLKARIVELKNRLVGACDELMEHIYTLRWAVDGEAYWATITAMEEIDRVLDGVADLNEERQWAVNGL